MPTLTTNKPLLRLHTIAGVISLVLALQVAAGGGFLQNLIAGDLAAAPTLLLAGTALFACAAIIGSFTATLQPQTARLASVGCSCSLALICAVSASHSIGRVAAATFFGLSLIGQIGYTYAFFSLVVHILKLSGRWATALPRAAAGLLMLCGTCGYLAQSWISLQEVTFNLGLARDLLLVAGPLMMAVAFTQVKTLRLDPRSRWNSLLLRLPLSPQQRSDARTLTLALSGAALSLAISAAWCLSGRHSNLASYLLSSMSWSWLGCVFLSFTGLQEIALEQQQSQLNAKLAPEPARRFLARYGDTKQNWAATIGIKTTNFLIDHDPGGQLLAVLPASILQIRSEEIQRCVHDVLGPLQLHSRAASHMVHGAVDAEAAVRPCVDVLKMFACLYLDAGPLVERRIKGLVSLLPIVDPGLAHVLAPVNVASLIRRNQWFFHFDFDWLDQHVVHSARSLRYDVHISGLTSPARAAMMAYLDKKGGSGNFVWLGPKARERLQQEAPSLLPIVEPCPVPSGLGGGELLMFTIRFEQLIPRLQRYFDLDTMRKALFDFEPSQESARVQLLLSLQLKNAQGAPAIMQILSQVSSVSWRGFREKDNALQLILAAHNRLGKDAEAMRPQILDAVKQIGYPSQMLHHAQVNKIALRDLDKLREVACSPAHGRFHEAWLVLSTADFQRYSPDQRRDFMEFLATLGASSKLAEQPLAQVKSVDALAGLARASGKEATAAIHAVLMGHYAWFIKANVGPNLLSLLCDAHLFARSHLQELLPITAATTAQLADYITVLTQRYGATHPEMIALGARWQELRHDAPGDGKARLAS